MDIKDTSVLHWILDKGIKDEKGEPLNYYHHLFLLDILTDWNKNIVVKKCSQIGGSVTFNLKIFFAALTYGFNSIYTFPSDSDVSEFVSSKTNPLLQVNRDVFGDIKTDSIERKEINGRFLFFKGTISKTAAIMTTADVLIHDEADRSDQKTLLDYKSRIKGKDSWKGRWIFSNPTTEKGAVDEAWIKSDQKEWHITCEHCKVQQKLQWPESIDLTRRIFICTKCKLEISDNTRRTGKWIADKPDAKVSGYHISHLMASWITADEIIDESEGDQEYFYNFVLGEPYNPGDLKITRSTILDNWTPKDLVTSQYYLGVDVGNIKHYCLGSERGLIKVGKFTKWSELDDILSVYKPITVIDALPDTVMSKYYVDNYTSFYMSYFSRNEQNPQMIVWWGEKDKTGVVYSNRNRILDQLIDEIVQAKVLFGLNSDRMFAEYIKHWETLRRVKEVDTKGIERYSWLSTTGEDHYVLSTLYWYLARLTLGAGAVFSGDNQEKAEVIKHTSEGDFANIGEVLEEILPDNR
jgi:hypothetical protein|tara:strand:+ start:2010 stop:3575 length:1566 start_codon:yes stop_codon:yes gene_type:complete